MEGDVRGEERGQKGEGRRQVAPSVPVISHDHPHSQPLEERREIQLGHLHDS